MRLKGRIGIITGSGSGIGKAIALAFSGEGAKVVINDIDSHCVEETVAQINHMGGLARGFLCDVTKRDEVQEMIKVTLGEFGQIDILVNNAGTAGGDLGNQFLEGLPQEVWERAMDINLKGAIHCTMAVIHPMMERRWGKIIFVNSMVGRYGSELSGPYYAAAKAGQLGFMRTLAQKMGTYGIYVNAVCPGQIASGPRAEKNWFARTETKRAEMLSKIPLGRRGTPEDIAGPVVFLASDESNYITGAAIDVNGGKFMS